MYLGGHSASNPPCPTVPSRSRIATFLLLYPVLTTVDDAFGTGDQTRAPSGCSSATELIRLFGFEDAALKD